MPNYAKNDMAAAHAAREAMERSGLRWFKAEVGDNYLRCLPPHVSMVDPESGAHRFYHPVCLHFGVGPNRKVVPCPRRMQDRFCPICDTAFALKNAGQEDAGNELLPTWQAYMNVIRFAEVRSAPTKEFPKGKVTGLEPILNKEGGIDVYIWSATRGVLDQIFDAVEERETEVGGFIDIADPEAGYPIKVKRKGLKKEDTKYRVTLDRQPTPIMDLVDEWDEQLADLTAISPNVDAAVLRSILDGGGDSDPFERKAITVAEDRFPDETIDGEWKEVNEEAPNTSGATRLKELIDGKKGK